MYVHFTAHKSEQTVFTEVVTHRKMHEPFAAFLKRNGIFVYGSRFTCYIGLQGLLVASKSAKAVKSSGSLYP